MINNQLFTDKRMKEVALYVLKKYPVVSLYLMGLTNGKDNLLQRLVEEGGDIAGLCCNSIT